ncbi:MAG: Flagellar hook-length control protein FliK [Candidatus Accumulibacter appositus]|uniref:Flagellar hook-length control protein FliK n=1 Tax=Candidatus Accumulibacter appositus TaxID=1454003 RepID=A0A011PKS2_9PROT|nr:flagellar hook-length control protein FliK [Accumulibacter sp.]EXI77642.1 MAG: Flagellar hook-length control protein FliK [Candidatus Accumulibacter appositus]HRF03904.1 flagellar hook-length control protein FliK [Accumulibacter sp.]
MIVPEITARVQPNADLALRPTLPAQEITDKLPGLAAGQRLLAEVQALLPNGTYRALINQRSVTLALPFAAKSGDAIELEVSESNGKLTLAVLARGTSEGGKAGNESTATQLSRTGQLIGTLLAGGRDGNKGGANVALPLNGNQAIAASPPRSGTDLLPLLKQAIVHSGMFYEAHQAEWVEGRYSRAQLLQEPQGKQPPTTTPAQQLATARQAPTAAAGGEAAAFRSGAESAPTLTQPAASNEATNRGPTAASQPTSPTPSSPAPPAVAPQLQAIVQQQLEAFATQNFSWQGQVWPGQQLHWEIDNAKDGRQSDAGGEAGGEKWQTRLRLFLPRLGEVDARLHIQGQQITLSVVANDAATRQLLSSEAAALRSQLERAGLDLTSLGVTAPQEAEEHGQSSG